MFLSSKYNSAFYQIYYHDWLIQERIEIFKGISKINNFKRKKPKFLKTPGI